MAGAGLALTVTDSVYQNAGTTQSYDQTKLGDWESVTVVFTPATDSLVLTLAIYNNKNNPGVLTFDGIEITQLSPSTYTTPVQNGNILNLVDYRSGSSTPFASSASYFVSGTEKSIPASPTIVFQSSSPGYNGASYARQIQWNVPSTFSNHNSAVFAVSGYAGSSISTQKYVLQTKFKSINSAGCFVQIQGGANMIGGHLALSGCEGEWQDFQTNSFTPITNYVISWQVRCTQPGYNATVWLDNAYLIPVAS